MENKCTECLGEGLIHQGESIHKVCSVCNGTGKGVEASVEAPEIAPEAVEEVLASEPESFLGEAGDESVPA